MSTELVSLKRANELDNSKLEGSMSKLQREAALLLGGTAEGTLDAAREGFSGEHYLRTAANIGLAAALTIAMKKPGLLGNVARGAGTIGAVTFVGDLASPRRLSALGTAMQNTWYSADNFNSSYAVVKKELGTVGFDTMLGIAGGAVGAGLATRFVKPAMPAELIKTSGDAHLSTPLEKPALVSTQAEPLNVFSKSKEPLGRALSNFAHTPFELDGVRYASVEAFYQGLKYLDAAKRAELAPLYGSYAKSAANKTPAIGETVYMGEKIKLGSAEHHALMERAIRAKIQQNGEIKQGLLETQNRPIVHDTGHVSTRKSNFPDSVFTDIIGKIRQDLLAKGETAAINSSALSALEKIEVKGGKSDRVSPFTRDTVGGADKITAPIPVEPTMTSVSDALLSIKKPKLVEFHNLEDYAAAFQGFDRKVSKVIGGGSDSVVLRLEDGNVLKITTRELPGDLGKRVFDLPVLEQGNKLIDGRQINYFVQPYAAPGKAVDLHAIGKSVELSGYHFGEPFLNQIGRYEGRPFLLDPFAVTKK